ncbi:hypothetical protein Droror1_Dr00006521 [Drosera rotundifolia]
MIHHQQYALQQPLLLPPKSPHPSSKRTQFLRPPPAQPFSFHEQGPTKPSLNPTHQPPQTCTKSPNHNPTNFSPNPSTEKELAAPLDRMTPLRNLDTSSSSNTTATAVARIPSIAKHTPSAYCQRILPDNHDTTYSHHKPQLRQKPDKPNQTTTSSISFPQTSLTKFQS